MKTWNDLLADIAKMSPEQRQKQALCYDEALDYYLMVSGIALIDGSPAIVQSNNLLPKKDCLMCNNDDGKITCEVVIRGVTHHLCEDCVAKTILISSPSPGYKS